MTTKSLEEKVDSPKCLMSIKRKTLPIILSLFTLFNPSFYCSLFPQDKLSIKNNVYKIDSKNELSTNVHLTEEQRSKYSGFNAPFNQGSSITINSIDYDPILYKKYMENLTLDLLELFSHKTTANDDFVYYQEDEGSQHIKSTLSKIGREYSGSPKKWSSPKLKKQVNQLKQYCIKNNKVASLIQMSNSCRSFSFKFMDYFNSLLTAKNPYEAKQMYNSFMSNIDSYLEEIPAWCEEDTFAKGIDFSIPQLKHTFLLASVLGTVCHNPSAQEANPYQKRQEERAWIRKRKADDIVREHQELEDILRDLFKKLDPNIIQESVYEALQGIDGNIHVDKIYFQNLSNDKTLSDAVGRLIIGKDAYVFKITKNQGRAEKEIFITTEARKIKKLQPYVPNVLINEPITNNGYSLVLYEDISKKVIPFSEEKLKTFEELGLRKHFTDPIMHRLYVLSLFHTYMKKHMNSPEVQKGKMASFNDYEFLAQRMLKQNNVFKKYKGDMVEIKKKYEECVRKLKEIDDIVTVLAHYDAKPDNFFNHIFLGDFGSVKPSNEYCDMARPFLLSPEVFRNSRTKGLTAKQYINSYIAMRKHEENFEVDSEEFYQHTLERAFVENLRIGAWEVSRGRDPTPYFKSMYNIKNLLKNNRKLWASAKINFSH